MYCNIFFNFFILTLICLKLYGQSLSTDPEYNAICGLSKQQIQETLSNTKKCRTIGIAKNMQCLGKINIDNNRCLTEQYTLIECLQKEKFLAQEQENEVTEEINLPNNEKLKYQDMKIQNLQNIVDGNKELENVDRNYEETVVKHLQSIDFLMKKQKCVDDLSKALIDTKYEFTATIRQQILDNIVLIK